MKHLSPARQPITKRIRRLRREAGSMLLILLIFLSMFIIAMGVAAPRLAQQVKRDREIEMIHRGEQYARAVKRFVKKTGQYPTRVEQLENTNNIRFLRKRYKDPMATTPEGEWKLVRQTDIQLLQGALGGDNAIGGTTGDGLNSSGTGTNTGAGSNTGSGTNSGTGFNLGGNSGGGLNSSGGTPGGLGAGSGLNSGTGTLGSSQGGNSLFGGGQTFGGGPFIGVASTSEKTGIHEFNNKKKYNQWLFVYDPTQDIAAACSTCVGVIIKGPYNPRKTVGASNIPGGVSAGSLNNQQNGIQNNGTQNSPLNNPTQPVTPEVPNR